MTWCQVSFFLLKNHTKDQKYMLLYDNRLFINIYYHSYFIIMHNIINGQVY